MKVVVQNSRFNSIMFSAFIGYWSHFTVYAVILLFKIVKCQLVELREAAWKPFCRKRWNSKNGIAKPRGEEGSGKERKGNEWGRRSRICLKNFFVIDKCIFFFGHKSWQEDCSKSICSLTYGAILLTTKTKRKKKKTPIKATKINKTMF